MSMALQYQSPISLNLPEAGLFLSMNNHTMPVTKSGLEKLKSELLELSTVKRPKLVERLSIARSMGDLSENSEYISAKEELAFIDGQISELEDLIANSQVVTPSQNGQISVGNVVTVQTKSAQVTFHIVGEWEADPMQKKISHSSPLGTALMGRKVGDSVEVEAPAGKILYTIKAIE